MYPLLSLALLCLRIRINKYNNIDAMTHFIKYLGIGSISTFIQFLLLALLVKYKLTTEIVISTAAMSWIVKSTEFKIAPEVIASAFAYFLSSIFNYFANYYFTFASNSSHAKTLPKFAVAAGLGLATNTLLFSVILYFFSAQAFTQVFSNSEFFTNYNYLVAQFLATGITVFLNFLVHKFWIYKGH